MIAINGINLHYTRTTSHLYGTIGVHRSFEIDNHFKSCFKRSF